MSIASIGIGAFVEVGVAAGGSLGCEAVDGADFRHAIAHFVDVAAADGLAAYHGVTRDLVNARS
jgi:citrate lyase beta subunit